MTLSAAQRTLFTKATSIGSGSQGVGISPSVARALLAIIARDMGVLPELAASAAGLDLYSPQPPSDLVLDGDQAPLEVFDALVSSGVPDLDTYFSCLSALHKGRLKYERILATQPVPTIDQVGPRGLLLYGQMPTDQLASLLLLRKWIFDIDNRAGQETGYIFEPILAAAIGGTPVSARHSPIRRRADHAKGRQVDCLVEEGRVAYEFKLRVTIAASGQGRWSEELDFPLDCEASGYTPALVVLDPTDDPKLQQLSAAFEAAGGHAFIGDAAWAHLEGAAGPTMATFVERYVRNPLADLLANVPTDLPPLQLHLAQDSVRFRVGGGEVAFRRDEPDPALTSDPDGPASDAADLLPGL